MGQCVYLAGGYVLIVEGMCVINFQREVIYIIGLQWGSDVLTLIAGEISLNPYSVQS